MNDIENLHAVLKQRLGNDKAIVKQNIARLTAAGDNYGSLMLAIKLDIKSPNSDKIEELHCVAKVPPLNEYIQKLFNIPVSFKNEIFFYKTLVPYVKSFIKEEGINEDLYGCYPEYYGGRLNLKDNDAEAVDSNAVLLLENLKLDNFDVVNRTVGFDLDQMKLVLENLAKFHAVPLAIKLKRPEEFEQNVMKVMTQYRIFEVNEAQVDEFIGKNKEMVESCGISEEYTEKLSAAFQACRQTFFFDAKSLPKNRNQFSTIIHTDMWVNNFMLKFENGKAVDCKIIDFQLYEFGNPARDLVMLLLTSLRTDLFLEHFDDLIKFYHDKFVKILQKFQCDIAPFSMENFEIELKHAAKMYEMMHAFIMMRPLYATEDDAKELENFNEDGLANAGYNISEQCKQRIRLIVDTLVRKNWI